MNVITLHDEYKRSLALTYWQCPSGHRHSTYKSAEDCCDLFFEIDPTSAQTSLRYSRRWITAHVDHRIQ